MLHQRLRSRCFSLFNSPSISPSSTPPSPILQNHHSLEYYIIFLRWLFWTPYPSAFRSFMASIRSKSGTLLNLYTTTHSMLLANSSPVDFLVRALVTISIALVVSSNSKSLGRERIARARLKNCFYLDGETLKNRACLGVVLERNFMLSFGFSAWISENWSRVICFT